MRNIIIFILLLIRRVLTEIRIFCNEVITSVFPSFFLRSFFVFLIIGAFACTESSIEPTDSQLGLDYFPLEVGLYRVYEVEETIYTVLNTVISHYQLKESVVDSFANAENKISYIIHRKTRADDTQTWQLDSVWTARRTAKHAIMVEHNISYIKMVFPVEHTLQWDGNALNAKEELLYSYDLNIADTTLNDIEYKENYKVIQSDVVENSINRDERYEVYAKGVGLIIKNSITLKFCQQDCPEEKTIDSGRAFKATLLGYGKE